MKIHHCIKNNVTLLSNFTQKSRRFFHLCFELMLTDTRTKLKFINLRLFDNELQYCIQLLAVFGYSLFILSEKFWLAVMVFKRQFGQDEADNLPISNNSQNPASKFRKVVNYVMKEASLQEVAMKISAMLEPAIRKAVKEEVEPLMVFLQSSPRNSLALQRDPYPSRSLQLQFVNKLPSTVFTNSYIEDEERAPLQIKLVDANSKNVIQHGPFSSIKVEIFVLNGDFAADGQEDWSETEVNEYTVRERDGKRPLLVGDLSFALEGGVGCIRNISFTDNSSWVRSRKFKLGVRVMSRASLETGIREAVSEAFIVLDHRGESYQKHNKPSLDDPVWRLKKISKQGASYMKLESKGIKTVKDFLMHYNFNSSYLRQILGKGVANRTWDTMVKHANECQLDNTCYIYSDEAEGAQLLFNCVYKVIAVKFGGQQFQPVDALDFFQKALVEKLKRSAFSNINQLVLVDNSTLMQSTIDQPCDARPIIYQGEPVKQLDYNLSESASYPCTIEDGNLLEDDSTSQTNQTIQGFTLASLMMGDPSAGPSDAPDNWYQNNIMAAIAENCEFGQPVWSLASNWGLGDELLTSSTPAAHVGIFSQLTDLDVNTGGIGKSKAHWCKIRAAVMWKIVRRTAAARRRAKFPFGFC